MSDAANPTEPIADVAASNEPTADDQLAAIDSKKQAVSERQRSEMYRAQRKAKRREQERQEREEMLARRLPLKFTIDTLKRNIVSKQLLRDMGIYIPFLIAFVFFFFAQRDVEQAYYGVRSTRDILVDRDIPANGTDGPFWKKTFFDMAAGDDFYEWLERLVIPNLWDKTRPNYRRNITRTTGQNLALGSLRVRLHKVRSDSCDVNSNFYPSNTTLVPRNCYGAFSRSNEDTASYGDNNITFHHESDCKTFAAVAGEITRYPCGGFTRDLPFSASYNEAVKWASEFRLGGFIDDKSVRFVIVEFYTYNPALDNFATNKIFAEVTKSGGWLANTRFRNFFVFSPDTGRLVYEGFFLLFVLYYWVKFVREWRDSREGLAFIFSLWPLFELVNLCSFMIVFICRWVWLSASQDESWTFPYKDDYPDYLDWVQNLYQLQVYFNSLNCVITFLKLLKFVQLNDRLNILTRTLNACAQNILGILILFVLVIVAYSITGTTLFGGGLRDYRNISTAFSTCMRIIIGNFDYESMKLENRAIAFIYFWTFVVLANFVLLNFIIAVISEGFEAESGKTKAVPVSFYVNRWITNVKNCCGSCGEIATRTYNAVVARSRRLPEVTILDYLQQWRVALITEQNITENLIESGVVAEPDLDFGRQDFKSIMPRSETEYISDEFLNQLWEELVIDYQLANKIEEEQDAAQHSAMIRRNVIRALTETLLNRQSNPDSVDFIGGSALDANSRHIDAINKLFTGPRTGLQGLDDRTVHLSTQLDNAMKLINVMVNKAGSLQYVGVKKE